ncbi:MAG: hypothetical protein ACLU4J_11280 [Butyricimonas paravirosa]
MAEGTQNTIALMLEPKKVGTAILTITDQCGETGVLKVEVHWPVFKTDDPYVYFYGTNAVEKSIYLSGNDEYEVVGDSKPGVVTTSFLWFFGYETTRARPDDVNAQGSLRANY